MSILRAKTKLIALVLLLLASSACAQTKCVFDENYFSEIKYKENRNISNYVWSKHDKEVKGITNDGTMFSIKHWSCDHYGSHAIMFLGPYFSFDTENINEYFMRLGNLALEREEISIIENYLSKKPISLSSEGETIQLNTGEYSEFYLAYSISNDILIFEIKVYRD